MIYERKTIDIFVSDELREVLAEFESDSLVAQLLLRKRIDKDMLVDEPINYISLSRDDKSKISYLSTDRIDAITDGSHWTTSKRFHCKPGSFIGKIFKSIPAKEVEKFSNLIRSYASKPQFKFEIVSGSRIKDGYYYENYQSESGSLGASCMKHESCQRLLNVYVKNPEICKMLIMVNQEHTIMGRALLWDFDSYKIMDRIYTINDEHLQFYFKKWAGENGYLHKVQQNWFNTLQFEQVGNKKQELKLCIKIDCRDYENKLPYFDTFKFMDLSTGYLYNYQPNDRDFGTLCSSDGSYHSYDYLKFDSIDKVFRYRSEAVQLSYLGENVWTHSNNARYSDVNNQYILNKDCDYNSEIDDYVFNKEYESFNNTERINERLEYLKKRKEELEKREKTRKKRSNSSWIESLVGNSQIDENMINEVYEAITQRTGIPQGYFTTFNPYQFVEQGSSEPQTESQTDSEPQPEPVE